MFENTYFTFFQISKKHDFYVFLKWRFKKSVKSYKKYQVCWMSTEINMASNSRILWVLMGIYHTRFSVAYSFLCPHFWARCLMLVIVEWLRFLRFYVFWKSKNMTFYVFWDVAHSLHVLQVLSSESQHSLRHNGEQKRMEDVQVDCSGFSWSESCLQHLLHCHRGRHGDDRTTASHCSSRYPVVGINCPWSTVSATFASIVE